MMESKTVILEYFVQVRPWMPHTETQTCNIACIEIDQFSD